MIIWQGGKYTRLTEVTLQPTGALSLLLLGWLPIYELLIEKRWVNRTLPILVANDILKAPRNCYCMTTMGKIHRVIVCGNGIALAGIESILGLDPDCEVIGHAMPVEPQELAQLRPDVVIYALNTLQPELLYPLAKELPNLLLIGIDLETNRAVLWFEQQAEGMSSQDLVQVIHQAKFNISISGR